jgi:hypothetical protein
MNILKILKSDKLNEKEISITDNKLFAKFPEE